MIVPLTPVRINPELLKATLPDLVLREGMSLVARVASRGEGGAAALVLGQALVKAQVPPEVVAGATLKLRVMQASAEQVVLKLVEQDAPGQPAAASRPDAPAPSQQGPQAQQLPALVAPQEAPRHLRDRGGGSRAHVRERARVEGDRATVAVGFTGEGLGALDAKLDLGPEGLTVVLRGRAAALLQAAAPDLQAILLEKLGRPVNVHVSAPEPTRVLA